MSLKLNAPLGRVAYTNCRLLDPAQNLDTTAPTAGVLTNGKTIEAVGEDIFKDGVPSDATAIDCHGHCLSPGLVDIRMKLRESSFTSTGQAAVAGGVTSAVCLPSTNPVVDDMSVVEFIARRARKAGLVKVYPYGACTKGLEGFELAEMGLLAEGGAVAFTDGNKAIADAQLLRQALTYATNFDLLIVQHPQDPSLSAEGVMNEGETSTRLGLHGIPREAEVMMVERDIRLVELTNGRIHFAHISTKASLDAIRGAKARGLEVTCDTAPPYFALNEGAVGDYRTFAKLMPPLRLEEDRQAIVEGIKDGTIDAIASDHIPQSEDQKRLPFAQAAFGGVGLETLLPISLELMHNGHMELLDVMRLLTVKPANLMGMSAGHLSVGLPADLIVFNPERGWKVQDTTLVGSVKNSPFDERPVQGRVLRTVVDGRMVYALDD